MQFYHLSPRTFHLLSTIPNPPDKSSYNNGNYCVIKFSEVWLYHTPVFSQYKPDARENPAPQKRTEKCKRDEFPDIYLEHPCRERDESSNYRKKPSYKNRPNSEFVKPTLR